MRLYLHKSLALLSVRVGFRHDKFRLLYIPILTAWKNQVQEIVHDIELNWIILWIISLKIWYHHLENQPYRKFSPKFVLNGKNLIPTLEMLYFEDDPFSWENRRLMLDCSQTEVLNKRIWNNPAPRNLKIFVPRLKLQLMPSNSIFKGNFIFIEYGSVSNNRTSN